MSDSVAHDQLRAFVERILRMKEEAKAIKDDIREIYAEAKGNGFDKTVLGQVVSYVEKRSKDREELLEREALFELYLSAFDGTQPDDDEDGTAIATHTHEAKNSTASIPPEVAADAEEQTHSSDAGSSATIQQIGTSELAVTGIGPESTAQAGSVSPEDARDAGSTAYPETGAPEEEAQAKAGASSSIIDFTPKPFRPYCLNRAVCAGMGRQHCATCQRAHDLGGTEIPHQGEVG